MAKASKKKFFIDRDITFPASACGCLVGTDPISIEITKRIIHLFPKDDALKFAYKSGKELINMTNVDVAHGIEVLPDLLEINNGDADGIKNFIEKHGFLLPLDCYTKNSVDADLLFGLINRLKTTVLLMNVLVDEPDDSDDYRRILALTLYLILTPPIRVNLPDENRAYFSCIHEVGELLRDICSIDEREVQNHDDLLANNQLGVDRDICPLPQVNESGEYIIDDTIRPPSTTLKADEYSNARERDFQTPQDKILYLYRNAYFVTPDTHLGIDFLYHLYKDVGNIQTMTHEGEIIFSGNEPPESDVFKIKFDKQLQTGLLKLARQALKKELEHNLRGVVPTYDAESMRPTWHVEYLLAGLYFSLFKLNAKDEQYHVCATPGCGRYYLKKTGSIKRQYCSEKCSNRYGQKKYRQKNNEEKITKKE